MQALLEQLVLLDRAVMDAAGDLRWAPATAIFVIISASFIKGPLFVLVGLVRDLRDRVLPVTALAVGTALLAGDAASGAIKQAVDRPRPPIDDPANLDAAVALPSSPSFPSGHATTAFAAAAATAILVPKLRIPALILATLVAVSRVYLGVHFVLDVLVGALLGTLIGAAVALVAHRVHPRTRREDRAEAPAAAPA